MADRLQQFSMLPSNFAQMQNPGAQMNQQQQGQDPSQQPVGGLTNPEHGRMWQQMQQQMQARQMQQAANGTGDMSGSQVTQPMAGYLGSQSLGQQQQQQHRAATFGLGPPGGIGSSQSPSFPDMQVGNNLGNFNNNQQNANNNPMNQMQLQAAFQQNRNNPMFPLNGNQQPQLARQIELMGLAQSQQPQNVSVNLANMNAARGLQPGQQAPQGFPQNMGAGGANGQGAPGQNFNGPGTIEHKRAALAELRDKAVHLNNSLKVVEQHQITLAGQRTGLSDAIYMQRSAVLEQDMARKRAVLTKWNMMLTANGMPPVGGNGQGMNPMGSPQNSLSVPQQNTPSWMGGSPSGSQGFGNQQMSPNQQFQGLLAAGQGLQNNTQVSPNSQFAAAQPQNANVPPLDRTRFNGSYKHFCSTKKLILDDRIMVIQNRQIDLHNLHVEVMTAGGFQRVSMNELWPVIGGRLGFVQLPGTDNEPPRSGPQVAQRIEHVYKEYLNLFDTIYIASYMQEASKRRLQGNMAGPSAPGQPQPPQGPPGHQLQAQPQQQHAQQQQQQQAQQQQLQKRYADLLQYAYQSAAEMKMRGLPEPVIRFVEDHRAQIQKTHEMQAARGQLPAQVQQMTNQQKAQQILSNMQPAAAAALANQAAFGGRQPTGAGFGQRSPEAALNMAMGVTGENTMAQQLALHQARLAQQQQQQQQQGQMSSANLGGNGPQRPKKPSQEDINNAALFVQDTKKDFMTRSIAAMRLTEVTDEQRIEYNILFENLWRFILEVDPKMTMYAVLLSKDLVRKLIAIVLTCQQQRSLLTSNPPKYILDLPTVKMMIGQLQSTIEMFNHHLAVISANAQQRQQQAQQQAQLQQAQQQQQQQQTQQLPTPGTGPQSSPVVSMHTRAPSNGTAPPPAAVSRTPSLSHTVPPSARKPSVSAGSALTPPQSVTTPAAALTPPSKSPKAKARPKPRPTGAAAKAKANGTANTNPPTPSPVMESESVPTPPPATPASHAATPSSDSSVKRRREDEEPVPVNNAPSPKRVKTTDWEESPSQPQVQRNEEVEKIKTEDDATEFFENLIKQASEVESQPSLVSDISDTLDQILKSYTGGSDIASTSGLSEPSGSFERRLPSPAPNGVLAIKDEFGDFFDFSSFAEDESGSKAHTPDLLAASSTNTSPESGSDPIGTPFPAEDPIAGTDLRRLGMWKEIDGGEGAFYQQDNWKWDMPMPTMDQPWAIFNT